MKPWRRFIFIFIAYGLALLHTAVPHQHPKGTEGKTTISQAGCLPIHSMGDLLQLVFSADLGYGHLETFQKSADTDIDFSLAFVAIIAVFAPVVFRLSLLREYRERPGGSIEKLHKRLLLFSSTQFRAPPLT